MAKKKSASKETTSSDWYFIGMILAVVAVLLVVFNLNNKAEAPADDTKVGEISLSDELPTVSGDETVGRENDVEMTPMVMDESSEEEEEAKPSAPLTQNLGAEKAVRDYFVAYNTEDFAAACGLMSSDVCNPKNPGDVNRFSDEREKLMNGYELQSVWMPRSGIGFKYDVVCAEYNYRYRASTNTNKITELMSFYVDQDEEGNWKIVHRICEKKSRGGEDLGCPILSRRDFCLE